MTEKIRRRFVRRAVRLARYQRWCTTVGLGLATFTRLAAIDAWATNLTSKDRRFL